MKLEWHAEDILRAVHGDSLHEQNWVADGVAIDSRAVKPNDLFIALQGPTHDAHDYVHQALANGAIAALVHHTPTQVPRSARLIYVKDTLHAMQDLGRTSRQRTKASIIALTGSVGKTTSKEMLRLILGSVGPTFASEGSFNNHWGVPLSLARMPSDARWGVFEIGMNHAGEITPLTIDVQPSVSLITNVEAVHLEHFANLEAIADAKAEIFLGMNANGTVVLNKDNAMFDRLAKAAKAQGIGRIWSFGQNTKSEARLIDYTPDAQGSKVNVDVLGQRLTFRLGGVGLHIAVNALGSLLTAAAAGADIAMAAESLSAFHLLQRRGVREEVKLADGTLTLIDETFNASPVAVKAALQVLADTDKSASGQRIAVLGDMRELGPQSAKFHTDLVNALQIAKIDRVYCCGDMMAYLYDALPAPMKGRFAPTSTDLAPLVASEVQAGDSVLVKGSKSIHMEYIVEALKKRQVNAHN